MIADDPCRGRRRHRPQGRANVPPVTSFWPFPFSLATDASTYPVTESPQLVSQRRSARSRANSPSPSRIEARRPDAIRNAP